MNPLETHPADSLQVLLALAWPWFQEWLKGTGWIPWFTMESKKLNRWASPVIALAATAGFHITGSTAAGWVLMIPPLSIITHVLVQWMTQHGIYTALIEHPKRLAAIQAALAEIQARAPKD